MRVVYQYIRPAIVTFSFLLAIGFFLYTRNTFQTEDLRTIRLVQYYGLTAITFLYLALIASPLYSVFPNLRSRPLHVKARRALGVSASFFSLLHGTYSFFGLLGGFPGLLFLSSRYLLAISLSFCALMILSVLAGTSFDSWVSRLGRKWKLLHRAIYIAALLIVIHVLMLGTHFIDLSQLIPQIFFAALAILLILEAIRFDRYLLTKVSFAPKLSIGMVLAIVLLLFGVYYLYIPKGPAGIASLGIHAEHIKLAQQANQATQSTNAQSKPNPGLVGDRTKRYTVSFSAEQNPLPNKDIPLSFTVYDAASGNPVSLYQPVQEKLMHLIVVDNNLTFFDHLHPQQSGSTFSITETFPQDGTYHLYLDFQPLGAIEQQFGFTVQVGQSAASANVPPIDSNLTKVFGDYEVTLSSQGTLKASAISLGTQTLTFTIKDAKTKQPVLSLQPYLGAFGHLVMINQQTYDYIHVHPTTLRPPQPNALGGPTVQFLPLGLYGPIKLGVYTLFGQFQIDGKMVVATFTIKVE